MLKALLKKQFLELNAAYFTDRKTGKMRTKRGIIGYALLYVFIMGYLAVMFFGLASMLCGPMIEMGSAWLYFALMGIMATLLGTFGSVFNTYASLYKAKDNDLLLSMPIPSSYVLTARLFGTYSMSLLYSAIVWVPTLVAYWIFGAPTVASIIFGILLTFLNALFVTVLTCILGWVVALVAARIKNKSFVTVVISLAFLAAYYFVCMRFNSLLPQLISNTEAIGAGIRAWVYPLYQMGLAASGEGLPMLIVTALILVLAFLCGYILSRSFLRLVTANKGDKKVVYKETAVRTKSVRDALYGKEMKRFLSSPTYMLNGGLGLVIAPALTIVAVIKAPALREQLELLTAGVPVIQRALPAILAAVMCMLVSMNAIIAPSVSLEGKHIWIAQSLPVTPWEVLRAKERLHVTLNIVPTVICTAVLAILLGCKPLMMLCVLLVSAVFVFFSAAFGLMLNLKKPSLHWTNETVPVKQSASVMIYLFGGWLISIVIGAACFFASSLLNMEVALLVAAVLLGLAAWLLNGWNKTKGAKIFAEL